MISEILSRLLKGDISILTFEAKRYIATLAERLVNMTLEEYKKETNSINELKDLLMVCNILYNRTDMIVLPVEDGVYDILLEKYKEFDPNFQVGSQVIFFKDQVERTEGIKKTVTPIFFYKQEVRDEIREEFRKQIEKFDDHKFDKRDIYPNPIHFENQQSYISKRKHDTKHNHPDLIGTLDKAKFVLNQDAIDAGVFDDPSVKILERDFFAKHTMEGIITDTQDLEMVIELKYDGISVEADCNRTVQSARTRGDTGIGEAADITPILKGYSFKRNNIVHDPIGVKFEAIILRSSMMKFNEMRERGYVNCRTAIVGLFGNSEAYKYQDMITLIPIAVDREQVPEIKNRLEEIEFINRVFQTHGEPLRYVYIHGNYKTCLYLIKKFAEEAKAARDYLNFMYDGIVVSYLDEGIRNVLGRKNFINKYQMAVKFDPLSKLTTFLGYTFEVGQTGTITPMIHYAPVEFLGTIHPKSSGHSYKRFIEMQLKYGDIIEVTYRNDVMPYVTKIDCEQNRQNSNPVIEFPQNCPICGKPITISKSGKTAICTNLKCGGRSLSRMVNMLQKLNIKGFAENTIRELDIYSFVKLMEMPRKYAESRIGSGNADNLITALEQLKREPILDYVIIGSLGFSGCASQVFKLIFSVCTLEEFHDDIVYNERLEEVFSNVKGIGQSIINTIYDEYYLFLDDIEYILANFNIINSKDLANRKQIRFSGCRNKQLEEQLNSIGYDANGNGSVTKSTDILIIPYFGYTSSKTSKVSENTLIIPIDEFIKNQDHYLSQIK